MERRFARIQPVTSYDDIADCDAVIEAVFEQMDVKKEVFAKLDATMKDGALLLTNTSALDVDEIASATKRPEAVAGAHFFSPANVMKILGVVRGAKRGKDTVASTKQQGKALDRKRDVAGESVSV